MRFTLSAEQKQFAATLHEMLSTEPDKPWERLAELGVTELAAPDSGAGPVDLVVAFEELGHHAVPATELDGLAFDLGALCCAAQLLGAGRAMLELTTDYARRRIQFGRPIGAFQAVKHRLADVLVALELVRPLVYGAAVTFTARDVSAAKIAATEAAHRSARAALQVHGAIGYTLDYELSRWLTLVRTLRPAWGSLTFHRTRVMANLVAPGSTGCHTALS